MKMKALSRNWTLSVGVLTSTFSFSPTLGDPNPNKPASDLAIRAPTEANVWISLTTPPNQVVGTGIKGLLAPRCDPLRV